MDKDTWKFLIGMLTLMAAMTLIITSIRGCAENESKLYVECVKTMHGHPGDEVTQACSRINH